MNSQHLIPCVLLSFAVGWVHLSGCTYPGAIYASHQAFGLGIHTAADGAAPVKVNMGYDQAVVAMVPRRGEEKVAAEATSLISKNNLQTTINPLHVKSGDKTTDASASIAPNHVLLQVDSALITGPAAIVAALPEASTVDVKFGGGTPQKLTLQGDSGKRIAAAVASESEFSSTQLDTEVLVKRVKELPVEEQLRVFAAATGAVDSKLKEGFENEIASGEPPASAFGFALVEYLDGAADDDPRYEVVYRELKRAMKKEKR